MKTAHHFQSSKLFGSASGHSAKEATEKKHQILKPTITSLDWTRNQVRLVSMTIDTAVEKSGRVFFFTKQLLLITTKRHEGDSARFSPHTKFKIEKKGGRQFKPNMEASYP